MGMPRRVAGSIMVRKVRTVADRIRRTKPDAGPARSASGPTPAGGPRGDIESEPINYSGHMI